MTANPPCTEKARVYIAGPMTGWRDYNFDAFHQAESDLIAHGYDVRNPARHGADPAKAWADYMRVDLVDVIEVDAICLLPDWEASRGARLEVSVAHALGLKTIPLAQWTSTSVTRRAA